MLAALEAELGVTFCPAPDYLPVQPDGFLDGEIPICVEAWSHQGKTKPGHRKKVMADMCKLLLVERLLGTKCRKIVLVSDPEALHFLGKSWMGKFAKEFQIEPKVVAIDEATRSSVREAQARQSKPHSKR